MPSSKSFRARFTYRAKAARHLGLALLHSPLRAPARLRDLLDLRDSTLFDRVTYLQANPDVAASGVDPLVHYVAHGADAGLRPNRWFDPQRYVASRPALAERGTNPLADLQRSLSEALTEHEIPASQAGEVAEPEVTVIVCADAGLDALAADLRGALTQSHPPLELLIADERDDGAARALLDALPDRSQWATVLRRVVPEESRGARNAALAQARGAAIAHTGDRGPRAGWDRDFLARAASLLRTGETACTYLDSPGEGEQPLDRFVHRRRLVDQLGGFEDRLGAPGEPGAELVRAYLTTYPSGGGPFVAREGETAIVTHSRGEYGAAAAVEAVIDRLGARADPKATLTIVDNGSDPTYVCRLELAVAGRRDIRLLILRRHRPGSDALACVFGERRPARVLAFEGARLEEGPLALAPRLEAHTSNRAECNVCGWTGSAFGGDGGGVCPGCEATPFGRAAYRYLADSRLANRRIRCATELGSRELAERLERLFAPVPAGAEDPRGRYGLAVVEPVESTDVAVALDRSLLCDGVALLSHPGRAGSSALIDALAARGLRPRTLFVPAAEAEGFPDRGLLLVTRS